MAYYLFNIGQPYTDAWWNRHLAMRMISTGFENAEGDRGDRILNDLDDGDWVIAYANEFGAIGAGVVGDKDTYRLVERNQLPPDFESTHCHFRTVDWLYSVSTLAGAVHFKELGLGTAPRHTKMELKDQENANRIVGLLAKKGGLGLNPNLPRDFYFYNTDADAITENPQPRFPILIAKQFAAVGGDRQQFGLQFEQLKPRDILLMYENRIGIVAVGEVQSKWDGVTHASGWYYSPLEMQRLTGGPHEYRIPVDWFLDQSDAPIEIAEIKRRLGFTPRGAVRKIVEKRAEIEVMIEELRAQRFAYQISNPSLPDRVLTTTLRIVRDTAVVRRVKAIHHNQCQICGHTIILPNGCRYSEGHHIRPLGLKHNGPDVESNILCVCPNHHAELDYFARRIDPSTIRSAHSHWVNPEYIEYHNNVVSKGLKS